MKSVSIILPADNEEKYLGKCLESIQKASGGIESEIIVVDNASTDRTAEIAQTFLGVTVLREERKGTSSARQCGYRAAHHDILIFVDADSRLSARWLQKICEHYDTHPATVCLSGPYLCYDLPLIMQLPAMVYWILLVWPASWFTAIAVGGGMAIRQSALQKAGGFDTSVTFYGDDTNAALRLRPFGRVLFDPLLVSWSSARRFKKEGLLRTATVYVSNFFMQMLFQKSWTTRHEDVR